VLRDRFDWFLVIAFGLLVGAVVLVLCFYDSGNKAVGVENTNNPNVKSESLFTDAEGYTVKRFYDNGRYHYYVVPAGEVREAQEEQSGKTRTTKYFSVPTTKKR
jgi:hypothetical protein